MVSESVKSLECSSSAIVVTIRSVVVSLIDVSSTIDDSPVVSIVLSKVLCAVGVVGSVVLVVVAGVLELDVVSIFRSLLSI